jgi:hypothetical protein
MANTYITPSLIAGRALATLYNTIVLAGLVWREFDADFTGKQGDTVTVRKPAVFTATDFDRSNGVTLQQVTENSTDVTLDTIPDMAVAVTDEEMTLEIDDFGERILTPMMEAVAQKIDAELAEQLVDAAEGAGGGGTVNKSDDPASVDRPRYVFAQAMAKLSRNKLPAANRYAVLSPEGHADVLLEDLFVAVDSSGSTDGLRNAVIGRAYGFETYGSIQAFGVGGGDAGVADGVAFHRDAVVLATRTLAQPKGLAPDQYSVQNYKGLGLRVTYDWNSSKKQDEVAVDILYGIGTLRPEAAVQLNLGQGS